MAGIEGRPMELPAVAIGRPGFSADQEVIAWEHSNLLGGSKGALCDRSGARPLRRALAKIGEEGMGVVYRLMHLKHQSRRARERNRIHLMLIFLWLQLRGRKLKRDFRVICGYGAGLDPGLARQQ